LFGIVCLVVFEAVSGPGSESAAAGTTYFYTTPSGLVLASPSTSAGTLLPEGYILSVPGTPAFALPTKVLPGQSEFFHSVLDHMHKLLLYSCWQHDTSHCMDLYQVL